MRDPRKPPYWIRTRAAQSRKAAQRRPGDGAQQPASETWEDEGDDEPDELSYDDLDDCHKMSMRNPRS